MSPCLQLSAFVSLFHSPLASSLRVGFLVVSYFAAMPSESSRSHFQSCVSFVLTRDAQVEFNPNDTDHQHRANQVLVRPSGRRLVPCGFAAMLKKVCQVLHPPSLDIVHSSSSGYKKDKLTCLFREPVFRTTTKSRSTSGARLTARRSSRTWRSMCIATKATSKTRSSSIWIPVRPWSSPFRPRPSFLSRPHCCRRLFSEAIR